MLLASRGAPINVGFPMTSADIERLDEGWTLSVNGEDKGSFMLPGYTGAKAGDVITLEHAMPERDLTRVYLGIRSRQQYVKAYIDDRLIYSYGEWDTLPYSRTPGNSWNLIDLSSGGETIRLELSCAYPNRSSSITEILIGPRYALFYSLFFTHFFPFLISILMMFCGLCLTVVGALLVRTGRTSSLFHLGMFCIAASIWCLTESNTIDLLPPSPFFITQAGYLALMICPIPMLLFLRSFFDLADEKLCDVLLFSGCAIFSVSALLQLFGLVDLLLTIYAGYGVIIAYSVYFFAVMVRKGNQLDRIGGVLFRSAVASIAVFTLGDLGYYILYLNELVADAQDFAYFFRSGLLFFILLLAAVSTRQIFVGYRRGLEADILTRMLEIDMMTGLGSRRTFDAEMESLRRSPPNERLAMILFDLNNLKLINDTLGHKKGDDLIKATAALIREIFSAHGKCYRIGGDEFIAILPSIDRPLLEARITDFGEAAAKTSEDGELLIDTAVGYGFFAPGIDADISALFTRVDDAMYRNKRLKKGAASPDSRPTETTGRRSTDMRE